MDNLTEREKKIIEKVSHLITYEQPMRTTLVSFIGTKQFADLVEYDVEKFSRALIDAGYGTALPNGDTPTIMGIIRASQSYSRTDDKEIFSVGGYTLELPFDSAVDVKQRFYAFIERIALATDGKYFQMRKEFCIKFQFDINKSFKFEKIGERFMAVPDFADDRVNAKFEEALGDTTFVDKDWSALRDIINNFASTGKITVDSVVTNIIDELVSIHKDTNDYELNSALYGSYWETLKSNRAIRREFPVDDKTSKCFVSTLPPSDNSPVVKIIMAVQQVEKESPDRFLLNEKRAVLVLANGHEDVLAPALKYLMPRATISFHTVNGKSGGVYNFTRTSLESFVHICLANPEAIVISDALMFECSGDGKATHATFAKNKHQYWMLDEFSANRPFVIATVPFPHDDSESQIDVRETLIDSVFGLVQSPNMHSAVSVGYTNGVPHDTVQLFDNIVKKSNEIDSIRQHVFERRFTPTVDWLKFQLKTADELPAVKVLRALKIGARPKTSEENTPAPPERKKRLAFADMFSPGSSINQKPPPVQEADNWNFGGRGDNREVKEIWKPKEPPAQPTPIEKKERTYSQPGNDGRLTFGRSTTYSTDVCQRTDLGRIGTGGVGRLVFDQSHNPDGAVAKFLKGKGYGEDECAQVIAEIEPSSKACIKFVADYVFENGPKTFMELIFAIEERVRFGDVATIEEKATAIHAFYSARSQLVLKGNKWELNDATRLLKKVKNSRATGVGADTGNSFAY